MKVVFCMPYFDMGLCSIASDNINFLQLCSTAYLPTFRLGIWCFFLVYRHFNNLAKIYLPVFKKINKAKIGTLRSSHAWYVIKLLFLFFRGWIRMHLRKMKKMRLRMVMEIRKRLSYYERHTQTSPDNAANNAMTRTTVSIHDSHAKLQCAP